jgi:hypothetical protein
MGAPPAKLQLCADIDGERSHWEFNAHPGVTILAFWTAGIYMHSPFPSYSIDAYIDGVEKEK